MAERKLIVQVIGDDSGLQRTLANSTRQINQFGRNTDKALGTGSTGGVSTGHVFESQLDDVREMRKEAELLDDRLDNVGDAAVTTGDKLARAAKIGAGFFALGRTVSGAGAALEAFNGKATSTSEALGDAGDAITSLITLDPAGFFNAVGASAKRSRESFDNYAKSLTDVNNIQGALKIALGASALGFEDQAKAIRKQVAALKAADAAAKALDFSLRQSNVTDLGDGRQALVPFRGAGVPEDRGLRGPGGVAIEQASRNPIVIETHVDLDGKQVAKGTTRVNEAERRRNPRQKRGPNSALR